VKKFINKNISFLSIVHFTLAMNGTANIDVNGDSLFENLHPVDESGGTNMSIYYSIKSNYSHLADCSQTILMDEIKVSSGLFFMCCITANKLYQHCDRPLSPLVHKHH